MGAGVVVLAIVAFAVLQHAMPDDFVSDWGSHPAGVRDAQAHLFGQMLPRIGAKAFGSCLLVVLCLAWAGYALAVGAGLKRGCIRGRTALGLIIALSLLLAVACPASLSNDTYAYAGYARLELVHGLNPYLHGAQELRDLHDPAAPFMTWEHPYIYGPVWLLLSFAILGPLLSAGLWWQVVAFKLLNAGALVGAALAGRRITRRLSPGREDLTLLAIGLNPLLLVEGPANGHNDLSMMCLFLWAAALLLEKRTAWGSLLLGLSIGIKFVPVLAVPWLLLQEREGPWRQRLLRWLLIAGLALAPTVIGYAPHWEGSAMFTAQQTRSATGLDAQARARDEARRQSLREAGVPESLVSPLVMAARQWPLVLLYFLLSVGLWKWSREGSWLDGWAALSAALVFLAVAIAFPWYLMWPWLVLLPRWDRFRLYGSAACFGLAVMASVKYAL